MSTGSSDSRGPVGQGETPRGRKCPGPGWKAQSCWEASSGFQGKARPLQALLVVEIRLHPLEAVEGPGVRGRCGPWGQFWSVVCGTEWGQGSGLQPACRRPCPGAFLLTSAPALAPK